MPLADRAFLFDLLGTPSPTGFEAAGQQKWAAYVKPHADAVEADAYGNVWATVEATEADAPTVLLEAHADEIGFIIKHIAKDGFIYVDRIGGSDAAIARGKRLHFLTPEKPVLGVIGNTAIHLRERGKDEKAPKPHELFVDIGAASQEDVETRGLRVGTPAVYVDRVEELTPQRLIGRALDNRLGGYVIAQVLKAYAQESFRPARLVALNSVQEEIGGHGAQMAAYRLDPDVALVIDVTHATDSPGIKESQHGTVALGGGPTITHGTVNHPAVVKRLMEVAALDDLALQHESSSRYSGTDTDVIFKTKTGIPSALISVPMRYMHSTIETVDVADIDGATRLMAGFVRSLRSGDAFQAVTLL
ncbi:MAG: M42 family metallopeptidase [Bacteroidota bacterium]